MINLDVNINEQKKSYPISISSKEISSIKEDVSKYLSGKNYVVIISQKVDKLYGKELGFEKANKFVLKDGEKEKNLKNYKHFLDFCLKKKLTREDTIIAIGGGVTGDMAGFAAATYMRGINFIQVPTTLLACVDSSVGGKTAVNTKFGKNLIGAFYQPHAVIINTQFLKTLDIRNFKTGLGEVVKYAFIEKSCKCADEFNMINFLEENYKKILEYDHRALKELIKMCIMLKISVIEKDEKESNLRRILNFGHTYGHAIELLTGYKKYTHGECVVAGIIFAFNLALENNLIDKNYMHYMQDVLDKFDFKKIPDFELKKVIPAMKKDKKSTSDYIRFILPTDYAVVDEFKFNDLLTIF